MVNGEIIDVKLNQSIEKEKTKVLLKTVIYDNEEEEIIDFAKSKAYSNSEKDDDYYVYGTVTKKLTNGNLTIDGTSYRVASDAQVFVYDDEINGSGRTAIAVDDTGYFVINDGQIVTIFYKEADDSEPEPDPEPANGDATKDPTGGTVNEVKATFTVDYLHGEDEAEAAEKVLTDAGWTINGRNHGDKKVTASKGAVEKQEFTYTATEYFTVKVDSTTYYVDKSGVAKGAEAELKLALNTEAYEKGTGYVIGDETYTDYKADDGTVGPKTDLNSNKDIDDNIIVKTGYVEVELTEAVDKTGASTGWTGGATATIAAADGQKLFVEAGKEAKVKVTITIADKATDAAVDISVKDIEGATVSPATIGESTATGKIDGDFTVTIPAAKTNAKITIELAVSDPE